jgi:hypothetical protein
VIAWLAAFGGWVVRPEVSFSHFGERGVIDVLAWHSATRSLLVIELKTEIVDVGELLGTLDRKLRNARDVARLLGWEPTTVSALLVVGSSDRNRRRVVAHAATFEAALPDRGMRLRVWLRRPSERLRGLMFFADRSRGQATERVVVIRRVRVPTKPSAARVHAQSRQPGVSEAR